MNNNEIQVLQGIDTVLYVRLLENAHKEAAHLIPYQTSLDFDMQRDSDSNATKSGNVATTSSLETDLQAEFVNNISKVSDDLYESLLKNKKIEAWVVHLKRVNEEGKRYAWYMRGAVTEDSNSNDPDDSSTREVSFNIDGTPKRGWLTLPEKAQAELDYIFRGVDVVSEQDATGKGTEWSEEDRGKGTDEVATTEDKA